MSIHVRISTSLRDYVQGYDPVKGINIETETHTAASLAQALRIPLDQIKFTMINGRQMPMQTELASGDRVAYFPAVGGG